MNDIFVSYASEDRQRILPIVHALEKTGWSVFWDKTIPAGKTWRQVIGYEIETCRCVLVVWSGISINKEWVLEEAEVGKKKGILIPILLDDVDPPFGFTHIQAADLIGWSGDYNASSFQKLVTALSYLLGEVPAKLSDKIQKTDKANSQHVIQEKPVTINTAPAGQGKPANRSISQAPNIRKYMSYGIAALSIVIVCAVLVLWYMHKEPEKPIQTTIDTKANETERIRQEQEIANRKLAEEAEVRRKEQEKINKQKAHIAELLARAKDAVAANHLTSPPDDNAANYYREVLELDPQNSDAHRGFAQIAEQYIAWAEQAIQKQQADRAEEYLNKARLVEPQHAGIAEVEHKIEQLRKEQEAKIRLEAAQEAERKKEEELQRAKAEAAKQKLSEAKEPVNESQAETPLSGEELKRLLSGNTVVGKYVRWGTGLKMYFDPSGSMRRLDSLNNREKGYWRIDGKGHLCLEVRKEGCNRVKRRPGGGYNVYRGGELKHIYFKVVEGNPFHL